MCCSLWILLQLLMQTAWASRQKLLPARCFADVRHDPLVIEEHAIRSALDVCNEFNLTIELPSRYNGTQLVAKLLRSGNLVVHQSMVKYSESLQSSDSTLFEIVSVDHPLFCTDIRNGFDFETEPNANIHIQIEIVASKFAKTIAKCELMFRIAVVNVNEKPRILDRVAINGVLHNAPTIRLDCETARRQKLEQNQNHYSEPATSASTDVMLQFIAVDSDRIDTNFALIADENDDENAKVMFSYDLYRVSFNNMTINNVATAITGFRNLNTSELTCVRDGFLQFLSPLSGFLSLRIEKLCDCVEQMLLTNHVAALSEVWTNISVEILVNATDSGSPPLSDFRLFKFGVVLTTSLPNIGFNEIRREMTNENSSLTLPALVLALIAVGLLVATATYWCKNRTVEVISDDSSPNRQLPNVIIKNENYNQKINDVNNTQNFPRAYPANGRKMANGNGEVVVSTNCSDEVILPNSNHQSLRRATILNRGNSIKRVTLVDHPRQLELQNFLANFTDNAGLTRSQLAYPNGCDSVTVVAPSDSLRTFSRCDSSTL